MSDHRSEPVLWGNANPILRGLRLGVQRLSVVMAILGMVVIAAMMLTITYDAVARYVAAAPTDWAYPLNSAGVLFATVLTMPYLYVRAEHIAMDLLHRRLADRQRRIADLVASTAAALLGLVIAVTSFRSMIFAFDGGLTGSGTFSIPLWVPDLVLFIAGLMLALAAVLFPPGAAPEVKAHDPLEVARAEDAKVALAEPGTVADSGAGRRSGRSVTS